MTSEENDWTSAQVARSAGRLIGFCSASPLRDEAYREIERCLGLPGRAGIKLHLGNSGISLRNADHLARIQALARLAQDRREWRNVYFDVATNVTSETTAQEADLVAQRLRKVGLARVLYGSDLSPPGGSIRAGWETFRGKVPLTTAEFERIARNRTRFAR